MIYSPIWKDTNYITNSPSAVYEIKLDGGTIYTGKAVRYPDAEYLKININKVCRNYLFSDIDDLLNELPVNITRQYHYNEQRTFNLFVDGDSAEDYTFYQDYSYDTTKPVTGTTIVSAPINGHYTEGMMRLRTTRITSNSPVVYTEGYVGNPSQADEYYGYNVPVKCTPYVLYYLNSYGGWDAFVIEGNVVKKESISSYSTDAPFDNTTIEFETSKYVNEIKTSYELNTSYLTDEESENLAKNLIGSLRVYLHNIAEGWVKPVIITDNNVTYQNYTNNGRKLASYKINVTESQSKIRR